MIKRLLLILVVLFPLLGKSQPNFFWDQLTRLHAPTNKFDTILVGTTNNLYLISTIDYLNWVLTNGGTTVGSVFPFDYTNFNGWTSNAVFNTPSTPLSFSPLDVTDKKQQMIYLDWGDSTSEFPESPVQVLGKKLLQRYGLGGFITPFFGGGTMYTAPDDAFSIVWQVTNGLGGVVLANGELTLSPYWGPQNAVMTAPSSLMWTNYRFLPPGQANAILNPMSGQWYGVTKAVVWYECSPTNSLGQFQVMTSTNNGPYGLAASVNCAVGSSMLTTTNVVIQLSSTPTTNYYQMYITNTVGSVRIPIAGMWNEYLGFTHYKMSQGGWDPAKYWRPDVELNNAPGWIQPVVPSWMTNTHDNLFKDSIPDLALMCNAHMAGDTNGGLGPFSFGTYTNEASQFVDLSATLNKWNPNMASVWITQLPAPLSQSGGIFQPWAMYNIIFTNNTSHDYPYFVGRNISGERWNQTFGINPSAGYPHWSVTGGEYVANEIWKELWSWSSAQRTTIGSFNGLKANASIMGTFGLDVTNGGGVLGGFVANNGYALSIGGDAGTNTRTAGAFKTGFIGYPTVDSTIPNAAFLGYSTFVGGGNTPQTEIDFGGAGPNGQSGTISNLFAFRSRGSNIWVMGGGPLSLPDGSLDFSGGDIFNATTNIYLTRQGTVFANAFYITGMKDSYWISPGPTNAGTGTITGYGTRVSPYVGDFDNIVTNLAGPCTINLLPGRFWTKGSVQNLSSGQILRGSGTDVTYLTRDTNFWPAANCILQQQLANANNIEISDMTLDCNARGNETNAIQAIVLYGTNNLVQRVKVVNSSGNWAQQSECFAIFLNVLSPLDATYANNRVLNCEVPLQLGSYSEGIFLSGNGTVSGNKVTMPLNTSNAVPPFFNGYQFNNSFSSLLINNISEGGNAGFYTDTGIETNITIQNNSFINCRIGIEFNKITTGYGIWGADISGNRITLASSDNSGSGSDAPAGIYIKPNPNPQTLYGIKIRNNVVRYQSDTLTTPNIWNAISVTTNSGALELAGNTAPTNTTYAVNYQMNPTYTPEMFGARGDLSADDTIPVQRCELFVEDLIYKGIQARSLYAGSYLINTLIITNRCNMIGVTKPAVIVGAVVWAPTFVHSGNRCIQSLMTNANNATGYQFEGLTMISSNQYYHNATTGPWSASMFFYATNAQVYDIQIKDCQFNGTDWALISTNDSHFIINGPAINGNTTNGFLITEDSGGIGNPQACEITGMKDNCIGYSIYAGSANINIDNCDFGHNNVNSKSVIVATSGVAGGCHINLINPNIELNLNNATDTTNFMIRSDNSIVNVFGGALNLGNSRPVGCTTNNGSIHFYGTPSPSIDAGRVLIVSDNVSVEGQSTIDSPIFSSTFFYYTNRSSGTKVRLTPNGFNYGSFDTLSVSNSGLNNVIIQNGNAFGALDTGADQNAATLTANVGKVFAMRFPAYTTTTYDNNFVYLNSGTGSTSQVNFGGNDSDASAGNAPNTYYFHNVNGGGAVGTRSFGINQFGFESFGTNNTTVNATGWTNTFALITPWEVNVVAYVSGSSGLSVVSAPANNTVVFTLPGTYTNVPITLHPNWALRGTGMTGTVVAQ